VAAPEGQAVRLRDEHTGEDFEITAQMVSWLAQAAALDEVGDNGHTDQLRVDSRAKMFAQVDRQIRARVDLVLPDVLRSAQDRIAKALDGEKIADMANKHRAWVSEKIREQRATFDSTIGVLVDNALNDIAAYQVDSLAARVKIALGGVVSKEVGRQLARFLKEPAGPKVAKKKRRGKA